MYNIGLANFDAIGGGPGGGMTEDQVKELINKNNTEVIQGQIQDAMEQTTAGVQEQIDQGMAQVTAGVQEQIEQATAGVQEQIDTAVSDVADQYDDTKIYASYNEMIAAEPTGREDVLYIITDEDNTRYIWTGSEYKAIEGRIDRDQINNLFSQVNG